MAMIVSIYTSFQHDISIIYAFHILQINLLDELLQLREALYI